MVCHFFYAVSVFTLYILQQTLFSCVLQHRLHKTQEWPTGQKKTRGFDYNSADVSRNKNTLHDKVSLQKLSYIREK